MTSANGQQPYLHCVDVVDTVKFGQRQELTTYDIVWMSLQLLHIFIICKTLFLSTHATVALSCPEMVWQ